MIKIWHNPRCSKSREGVKALEENKVDFETYLYLKEELTVDQLKDLVEKLGIEPIELVRTKEAIWKTEFKGKDLSDEDILNAMIEHPRLIERPVVVVENKAVIGRPTEAIVTLLENQ